MPTRSCGESDLLSEGILSVLGVLAIEKGEIEPWSSEETWAGLKALPGVLGMLQKGVELQEPSEGNRSSLKAPVRGEESQGEEVWLR